MLSTSEFETLQRAKREEKLAKNEQRALPYYYLYLCAACLVPIGMLFGLLDAAEKAPWLAIMPACFLVVSIITLIKLHRCLKEKEEWIAQVLNKRG